MAATIVCACIVIKTFAIWRISKLFPNLKFIRLILAGSTILGIRWALFAIVLLPGGSNSNDPEQLWFRSVMTALGWTLLAVGYVKMAHEFLKELPADGSNPGGR